jgi:hypothetical protein
LTLFAEETVVWWASKVLFTVDGAVVLAFGLFQDNTVPDTSGKGCFPDEVNDPSFGTNFDVAAHLVRHVCGCRFKPGAWRSSFFKVFGI